MAYDTALAERIRGLLSGRQARERQMFGGLAFLIGGNMSVAASGQGGLLVRVDPQDAADLLHEPGVEELEMAGRPARGWLRVRGDVVEDDDALAAWVARGVAVADSLPPK